MMREGWLSRLVGWLKSLLPAPKAVSHPRDPVEVLDDYLVDGGLDDYEFAAILGVSDEEIDLLLTGGRKIDAGMAERLGQVLRSTSAGYWLSLQSEYDEWRKDVMSKEIDRCSKGV